MIVRFCLYSSLKNLRFFESFFILYLLSDATLGGPGLSYFQVGALVGYQKFLTGLLEIPSGVATDRWGRRRALILTFGCYAVAFPMYAISTSLLGAELLVGLYTAQTFFGVGEAFRTGSHKAIMLDWADRKGRSAETTHLIGMTRLFSKLSLGLSALAGGFILYRTGDYRWLFWASTFPAVLGVLLMMSYPGWLEGEMSRHAPTSQRIGLRLRFKNMWAAPGIVFLLLQSMFLESQLHLAQLYVQPFLKSGLQSMDLVVVGGVGSLLIGTYFLIQNSLGGVAALLAVPFERLVGDATRALQVIYSLTILCCLALAVLLFKGWFLPGILVFVLLVILQNARRPIFVSQFNRVMDKPQRATTLSIESQARTWTIAVMAPLTGYVADHHGLPWVFVTLAGILVVGLLLHLLPRREMNGAELRRTFLPRLPNGKQ